MCASIPVFTKSGIDRTGRHGQRLRAGVLSALILLTACGGGGGGEADSSANTPVTPQPSPLDNDVLTLAGVDLGLTGDPASLRGAARKRPDDDPLVKLGQLLFFSQTLAGGYDVSCGTCHHPDFAGSDGLSIPVGVAPVNAATVGPGREVDVARDLDPAADGGPNVHRNSQTTFNSALFDRVLLHDGRIQVLDSDTVPGGEGQLIQTPESGQRSDPDPVSGLLEFQAKAPFVNDNEMRGFFYTEYGTGPEYRGHLVRRLRGEVDTEYNGDPDGPANWLARFRLAFDSPGAAAEEIITMPHIQRALAAYVESQTFVDTPWRRFLAGDVDAISIDAKRGALLFLQSPESGGLGCARCHAGDRFTDEAFHNVGFPQLGRGFQRADRSDMGRWLNTQDESDRNAFRTPGLLNVAETDPYGHAGSFPTLEDAIAYHADPRTAVETFDFAFTDLAQFRNLAVEYPHAEPHTRAAIEASSFAAAEAMLPGRTLFTLEIVQLAAFLRSLSDDCVTDPDCIAQWTPSANEDPDGNMLVRDLSGGTPGNLDASSPGDYPAEISLNLPPVPALDRFQDVEGCTITATAGNNTGDPVFARTDESLGLTDPHRFDPDTWFEQSPTFEITMIAGGVTAAYLDTDCWPDLIFAAGDAGMLTYRNVDGAGFEAVDLLQGIVEPRYTGTAIADLNGDYRRELVLGNFRIGGASIFSQNNAGNFEQIASLPMTRTTFGISFGPLDQNGYPYLFLSHWSGNGTAGTAPALWKNDGQKLYPWDKEAGTDATSIDQRFNFTPAFADFTGDGLTDLVIASDFSTSVTLRNVGSSSDGPVFEDQTDRSVISDQNGMGSALLDIDNDGNLEWFVTSIYEAAFPAGNWGTSGNRLYRNVSTVHRIAFEDITDQAQVRDGLWGWGACADDFDNNGFVDLFHVNGFGFIPYSGGEGGDPKSQYDTLTKDAFQAKPSRLFINDGDGTFTESAADWNIAVPSEGRGLACFDHDRDGDVDIVVLDHSTGLQFFENRSGAGAGRAFLNVRLVGAPSNTDAIGARVYVTAAIGHGFGQQTQLRLSQANSNFNSQNTPDLHFGLGQASRADTVRVVWPDRTELTCTDVSANRFVVLDQRLGDAACVY